jgi:segregation and condensation protein A
MSLEIKLQVFEGPMDLLMHLIDKNQIDIYDIPIVTITEQYMEYINAMQKEDMEVTSEFLVMAATLIDIKCKMLLPPETDEEGEEIDPRAELVAQLLEYKTYKYMSYELRDRMDDAAKSLYKPDTTPKEVRSFRPEVNLDELVADITLAKLHEIFDSVLRRQTEKIDPVRSQFGTIKKEEVRLADKLVWVADTAKKKKRMSFRNLLAGQRSKVQVIVTFLAMLELMKYGIVEVTQEETAGDIMIEYVPGADISAVNLENDFGEAGGESLE